MKVKQERAEQIGIWKECKSEVGKSKMEEK
jgi:hypothetical protein